MKGCYYDYFDQRWIKQPSHPPAPPRRLVMSRQTLLCGLVEEIEQGDGETVLYASLLARKLIGRDYTLMAEFGRRITEKTMPASERTHRPDDERYGTR